MTIREITVGYLLTTIRDGLTWVALVMSAVTAETIDRLQYFERPLTVGALVSLTATFIVHLVRFWLQTRDQDIEALREAAQAHALLIERTIESHRVEITRLREHADDDRQRWVAENQALRDLLKAIHEERKS